MLINYSDMKLCGGRNLFSFFFAFLILGVLLLNPAMAKASTGYLYQENNTPRDVNGSSEAGMVFQTSGTSITQVNLWYFFPQNLCR